MVTAIEIIEESNYVASADDTGKIKFWDLRTMSCVQTYRFEFDILVNGIICTSGRSFCSVSNRLYMFNMTSLDMDNITNKKEEEKPCDIEETEIVDCCYNRTFDELILATK